MLEAQDGTAKDQNKPPSLFGEGGNCIMNRDAPGAMRPPMLLDLYLPL